MSLNVPRLGDGPLCKQFETGGLEPFLSPWAKESPRPGRSWDDAKGHVALTYTVSLPGISDPVESLRSLRGAMGDWLRVRGAVVFASGRDIFDEPGGAGKAGMVHSLSFNFHHGAFAGSLLAWVTETEKGLSLVLSLIESRYPYPEKKG